MENRKFFYSFKEEILTFFSSKRENFIFLNKKDLENSQNFYLSIKAFRLILHKKFANILMIMVHYPLAEEAEAFRDIKNIDKVIFLIILPLENIFKHFLIFLRMK